MHVYSLCHLFLLHGIKMYIRFDVNAYLV